MNPQFVVQIPRGTGSKCHVVVAVTQQYGQAAVSSSTSQGTLTTSNNTESKSSFHAIGFAVYEGRPNTHRITTHFVTENVGNLLLYLAFDSVENGVRIMLLNLLAAPSGCDTAFCVA